MVFSAVIWQSKSGKNGRDRICWQVLLMKAMILAAGLGSRLGQLSAKTPKCLMPIAGKTILEHVVERLKACQVDSCVINLHHLGDQVEAFIKQRGCFGIEFTFSYEKQLLGTGGGLQRVEQFFADEDFIVYNADIYCELELRRLLSFHASQGCLASLVVMERQESSYLLLDQNFELVGWEKKEYKREIKRPACHSGQAFAFCGMQVVSPRIFPYLRQEKAPFSIIEGYMRAVQAGEMIKGFLMRDEYWADIGTMAGLEAVRQRLGG